MGPMVRPSSRPSSLALQCFIAVLVVALVRPPPAQASAPELYAGTPVVHTQGRSERA